MTQIVVRCSFLRTALRPHKFGIRRQLTIIKSLVGKDHICNSPSVKNAGSAVDRYTLALLVAAFGTVILSALVDIVVKDCGPHVFFHLSVLPVARPVFRV